MRVSWCGVSLVVASIACGACNRSVAGVEHRETSATTSGQPVGAPAMPAPGASASPSTFSGTIVETMDSGAYTYARLTHDRADVWIAAPQFNARVGEPITVALDMPMQNFASRTLERTFPLIYFVQEVGRQGQPLSASAGQAAPPSLMTSHGTAAAAPSVAKNAPPPGGLAVADVFARKAQLSGKAITVRGTVVKVNAGIMDRNFIHLQDGSGDPSAQNHDLTVTTAADVKPGDVVTASGVLGTGKDFGAGYAYDAILENATVRP